MSQVVSLAIRKIIALVPTQASPISMSHRVIICRKPATGTISLTSASSMSGVTQTIVLIVQADKVRRPFRFLVVFAGKRPGPSDPVAAF